MSIIKELFGRSPFGVLVEHSLKVNECVKLIWPLFEALLKKDYEQIHRLQDEICRKEYEADKLKHEIRENLPRRILLPVDREDLEAFLKTQDRIADCVQDLAVVLLIRKTEIHPQVVQLFTDYVHQVVKTADILLAATKEMQNLAETCFGGIEAENVMRMIKCLGEEEWQCDRIQRRVAQRIYEIEKELDPVTVFFYEKILTILGQLANSAENTGDLLRVMILK